jgi:hypothetical protein
MGILDKLSDVLTGSAATKALSSRSHADRQAALETRKKEIEAHRERIREEHTAIMARAASEADEETARAQKIANDRTDALSRELAPEIRKRVDPLVAQFVHARTASGAPASPRETVRELKKTWQELDARTREETGEPLDERLFLSLAFLDLHEGNASALAASKPNFFDGLAGQAAHAAAQALLTQPLPSCESALRYLDEVTAKYAAAIAAHPVNPDRVALTRIHAARGRAHAVLQAFDAGVEAARQAANDASAVRTAIDLKENARKGKYPRISDANEIVEPEMS